MKKICSLQRRWLILLLFLLYALNSAAQTKAPPETYTRVASQVTFIVHAPVVLPALLERRQYDTMGYYLQNWKNSNYPSLEFIFAMQVLLAIQSDKYTSFHLPFESLNYLSQYAKEQTAMETKADAFRYYIKLNNRYSYDASDNARKTMLFIRSWSKILMKTHKLTTSQLFFCRTLTGDITEPRGEFTSYPGICPDLEEVEEQVQDCKDRNFDAENSKAYSTTIALMAGGWFPTRNLQALGVHPSLGVSIGRRNRLNEFDVSFNYRFIHTTPHSYDLFRQDTVYSNDYYEGGYIGLEYTRYLINTRRQNIGLTTGIGYDIFSMVSSSGNSDYSYLNPTTLGSFNWNAGIRYKYFANRNLTLGCVAKYNVLHYVNAGGTNLTGNAFTIDFTIGMN